MNTHVAISSSQPLVSSFMVSAPGKVILYGEHAVVYDKAAIAAAISLRSYLLVTFPSNSNRTTVSLYFPDIGLCHSWDIKELPWVAFSAPGKKKHHYDLVTALDPDLTEALQPHVQAVSLGKPQCVRKAHLASVSAFLYLFLSLSSQKSAACTYTLRSTIPIGAGLGSSASVTVCLATALLLQQRALSRPCNNQSPIESELHLKYINRWAFVGELCYHGNPSGVDNTVSSGGKAVLFQNTKGGLPVVTSLRDFPEFPLLIVNTETPRSTAIEVARVQAFKNAYPAIAEHILDAIHGISKSAYSTLTSRDPEYGGSAIRQHLGDLMVANHGLLVALGVSHPRLERIRSLIDHTGIGWTKLTGAGGGGCTITLLKPGIDSRDLFRDDSTDEIHLSATKTSQTLLDLERTLANEGFKKYEATLAGDGVGVLWPAVQRNGKEIDQESFLNAAGCEDVEALVGISQKAFLEDGISKCWEDWKFWR
ncbi:mevalonate kinase [Neofusicoccum parvum]|nr:mevalonate kinase [Neofusicoccum parvum]